MQEMQLGVEERKWVKFFQLSSKYHFLSLFTGNVLACVRSSFYCY